MARNKLYFILLIIGALAGLSFGIIKARASKSEGEISAGEQPASVYYDETWNATAMLVSGEKGYKDFDPYPPSAPPRDHTLTAAKFDNDGNITVFPKFVVREWTVHGHIHFE